jgi:hypothetical protein
VKFVPALVLIALALPSTAFGLTSRSWVSGTGDDANPCSRTKPCKTFAGALPKTAAGGVIGCLNPGGYSGLTITKSIRINCSHSDGGILAAGTNAIVVNGPSDMKVTLRGLDLNGTGVGPQVGQAGVLVARAASVHILDSEISRFKVGVDMLASGSTPLRVVVAHSHIHDNGIGLFNGPDPGLSQFATLAAHDNLIADNVCGIVTSSTRPNLGGGPDASNQCGTAPPAGQSETAVTSIFDNGIYDNGSGVYVRGPDALALVAYNRITGNYVFGMHRLDGGTLRTYTPATNVIDQNAASDAPNSFVAQTKREAKTNRER